MTDKEVIDLVLEYERGKPLPGNSPPRQTQDLAAVCLKLLAKVDALETRILLLEGKRT